VFALADVGDVGRGPVLGVAQAQIKQRRGDHACRRGWL
jgi:hypothetical protein